MTQYELALKIAIIAHKGQFRHDGVTPYIEHPIEVADQFDNDTYKAIAVLHDVIEDCEGYDGDTLRSFGINLVVVECVELITHWDNQPYDEYIDQLTVNPVVTKIKIADLMCNLCDGPTDFAKARYKKYIKILLEHI